LIFIILHPFLIGPFQLPKFPHPPASPQLCGPLDAGGAGLWRRLRAFALGAALGVLAVSPGDLAPGGFGAVDRKGGEGGEVRMCLRVWESLGKFEIYR